MIYERTILNSIKNSISEYPVTLVTGARQVGKSTLVSHFEKQGFKYITFDDTDLLLSAKSNPKKFIEETGYPLIIDEIQRAKELFIEIESQVNKVRKEKGANSANGMYILTGSQKFQLMKGVSESLSGRCSIIEMEPLSQCELRGWKEEEFIVDNEKMFTKASQRSLSDEDFYSSVLRGFYPARWEIPDKPIKNFYSNYVKTYIDKDVSELMNVRDTNRFSNFLKVVASLTGEEYNANNIAKTIGIDNKTVDSWMGILLASNLVTFLNPYYESSMNKRIVKTKKIYMNDTGLACHLMGIDTPKTLSMSPFKGRIIETYIFNEIKKTYVNHANGDVELSFYRDNNQNEIDLILRKDGNLYLVEAKSGKNYGLKDIKGFKQLLNSSYNIAGQCIICSTEEPYRISSQTYAFPIRCI